MNDLTNEYNSNQGLRRIRMRVSKKKKIENNNTFTQLSENYQINDYLTTAYSQNNTNNNTYDNDSIIETEENITQQQNQTNYSANSALITDYLTGNYSNYNTYNDIPLYSEEYSKNFTNTKQNYDFKGNLKINKKENKFITNDSQLSELDLSLKNTIPYKYNQNQQIFNDISKKEKKNINEISNTFSELPEEIPTYGFIPGSRFLDANDTISTYDSFIDTEINSNNTETIESSLPKFLENNEYSETSYYAPILVSAGIQPSENFTNTFDTLPIINKIQKNP